MEQFKATLKETPWDSVFIFDDIDDMLSSWELLFNTALDSNCPWRVKRVAKARKLPWLNSSVTKQLRERDRLLKIAKRSQNPADWESYKAARNKAVSLLRRAKSQFFKTTLEHNKNNPKGIWKTIKSLIGVNKQQSIHRLRIDGHNIVNNKEMAEAFNSHFSTIANKLRNLLPDILFDTAKLSNFVRSRKDESAIFSIPTITERDVVSYLLKIDSNKSTGIDDISSRMLKLAAPFIAPSIARLINLSFSLNVFPCRWKTAKVTPIFKSGDPADVTNYRPISVLPILSKIAERHVYDALYSFLSENDLIYTRQSGFRPRHSTETALIKVIDDLLFNLDNDCVSGMVLIDYRKAFDMIDHTLLLKKLEVYGLSTETLQWFTSYLTNRRQLVKLGDKQSNLANVPHGIPQGSILGPLLFIVFINDLPFHVTSSTIDLYADDTTLTSCANYSSIDKLEQNLNSSVAEIAEWAASNKLPINESKTKAILITGKRLPSKINYEMALTINGTKLEVVPSVKLLGLEIDFELSFNSHVEKLCTKLSQRIGILKKIRSCLPMRQRLLFYNSMIRSVWHYVSSIWTSCDKENLGRVLKLQKRAARVISDADNQASSVKLFNRLQWLPFYEESKIAKCCVAYKRIKGEVPLYTKGSLILNSQQHNRATRYSNINFICPRFNRMTEGGRSFAVTTCQLWNSLSLELRNSVSLESFRNNFRKNLFAVQRKLHHFIV